MSRKRPVEISERDEMMKLTKVAKSWEFTCSFCFKKFASAQAMGGHQNAHRSERLEEKRLFVRDPIGYRKRAFLRAMKPQGEEVIKDSSAAAAAAAFGEKKELTFAVAVAVAEEDAQGKASIHDFNINAINLDLTLKL